MSGSRMLGRLDKLDMCHGPRWQSLDFWAGSMSLEAVSSTPSNASSDVRTPTSNDDLYGMPRTGGLRS